MAVFCGFYGVSRFALDSLRVNDALTFGFTGAQWLCLVLMPVSIWIWFWVRKALAQDVRDGMTSGIAADAPSGTSA
jgi:prolipoprotein diacylglyceryltransferase